MTTREKIVDQAVVMLLDKIIKEITELPLEEREGFCEALAQIHGRVSRRLYGMRAFRCGQPT